MKWKACELWIAFKNLIFDYWTQPLQRNGGKPSSCELLSKILSLTIEHNNNKITKQWKQVVNCFQKSYLWLLNTTGNGIKIGVGMLWIAFKNLIFDYWTQLIISQIVNKYSCELLSKILSLTIEHNFTRAKQHSKGVVNCFQKSYLWLLNTTELYVL